MKSATSSYLALSLAAVLFSGCTKTDPQNNNGPSDKEDLLTDPGTGWKRIAVIPFSGSGWGASPYHGMQGFDLQQVAGKFAVLYTQHGMDPLVHSTTDYFYKALVAENATADKAEEISFGIFTGGGVNSPFTYYGQFLPGSYTPAFTGIDYTNNYIELRDKEGDTYAGAPAANYPLFRYMADGQFIAGALWQGHESFLWHYKNPPDPPGDFSSSYRPGIIDGHKRLFNVPFKASDGSYYEYSLCSKDNAVTFLAIRCREDIAYGSVPPNYEIVDQGAVTGLPQSGYNADFIELLTYEYNNATGELTFVFDDYRSAASGSDERQNIYCYRWKQGSLTRLWQASMSGDADFRHAMQVYNNKNMLQEWRLKPDGTFYTMSSDFNPGINTTDACIKLWEVNGSGIQLLSSLTRAQTLQKSMKLSTCRFIGGSYYALAYPIGDDVYKIGDPRFHMEVVQLLP